MSSAVGVSWQPLHPLPIAALLFPCSCRASERKSHKAEAKRSRAGAKEKTLECGQIVWGLAFSAWPAARHPDGAAGLCCQVLATGLNDGQIKVWEVQTGERLRGTGVRSGSTLPSGGDLCSALPQIFPELLPQAECGCEGD